MDHEKLAEMYQRDRKQLFWRVLAIGMVMGFLLGLGAGLLIAEHTIGRTVIIPFGQGQDV